MKPTHIAVSVGVVVVIILAAVFLTRDPGVEIRGTAEICDLIDNDGDGQIDEGLPITCENDESCGPSGAYGDAYCYQGSVVQGYMQNQCSEPGTCLSECSSEQTYIVLEECSNGCSNAACV